MNHRGSAGGVRARAGLAGLAGLLGLLGAASCQDAPAGCAGRLGRERAQPGPGASPPGAAAPAGGEEREASRGAAVIDLLAQRPLALVYEDDALIIDTAPPEIYKFLDGAGGGGRPGVGGQSGAMTIITGERDRIAGEDRRVALADGLTARLRFPGDSLPRAAELSLWLRPAPDVARQALSVFLNERLLANLELAPGFQRYRVAVPEGRLSSGENSLRLFFRAAGTLAGRRSAAALARVTVGPAGRREGPPGAERTAERGPAADGTGAALGLMASPGRVRSFGIGGDARLALAASRPTRWSYYLVPPPGAAPLKLTFAYGVQTGGRPASFSVRGRRDGGDSGEVSLWTGRGEPGRWQEAEVSLAALAPPGGPAAAGSREGGAALRLDLAIVPARGAAEAGGVAGAPRDTPSLAGVAGGSGSLGAIAQPRLVLQGAASSSRGRLDAAAPHLAPEGRGRPDSGAPRAEHLLVFVVDALRADRVLPQRGAHPRPLPAVAQLLQGGVGLRATTQGNFPLPAHASLLSGTYPAVHRMVRDDATLPDSVPLLAETLRRAGFATGLFSGSGYVSERWGLRRGFDAYRNLVREGLPNASGEVWKAARAFLEEQVRAGRRAFLYVAASDPHAPYNPPPDLLARTLGHPNNYSGPLRPAQTAEQLLLIKRGRLRLGHEDRAYLEALYDAEVLQMDATLGQALADLQRLGIADKTAVAFAGSHGEELLDHGSVGHGHSLYDELITVPVVLRFPPRVPAAGRGALDLRAELCDLMPTLLQLAGAAVPDGVQGASLLPLLQPGAALVNAALPRAGLSQHEHQRSIHLGRYHLILSGEHGQFFDLQADPLERQPLDPRDGVALRALRNPFALFLAYQTRWSKARLGQPAQLHAGFLEEIGP